MTTLWDRQFGRTDRFAVRLALLTDPDSSESRLSPELKASWGEFALYVDDTAVTATTAGARDYREGISCYLLPVAEWFAKNWAAIFLEETLPPSRNPFSAASAWNSPPDTGLKFGLNLDDIDDRRYDWFRRHSLAEAFAGVAVPTIFLRPAGGRLEISWVEKPEPLLGFMRRFVHPAGSARVPLQAAAEVLQEAWLGLTHAMEDAHPDLGDQLSRLRVSLEAPLANTPLARLTRLQAGREIIDLVGDEAPDLWTESQADRRIGSELVVPERLPAVLFRGLGYRVDPSDVRKILDATGRPVPVLPRLTKLRQPRPPAEEPDYHQGYALALEVRELLGVNGQEIREVDKLALELGLRLENVHLRSADVKSVAVFFNNQAPVVLLNKSARYSDVPWVRRMNIAHELCHILFDEARAFGVASVSGPWFDRRLERRANAFAIMFLAPTSGIQTVFDWSNRILNEADLQALMVRFGLGRTAMLWHLTNLEFIDEVDRERLLQSDTGIE